MDLAMPYDARVIANFVLDTADRLGLPITNMALNKIIYFSHGWYLAQHREPLVNYKFEAWEHGPVLPNVYHQFKSYRDRPIDGRATSINLETGRDELAVGAIDILDKQFLERMTSFYGLKPAHILSSMSHESDAPWAQTRGAKARPGMVISDESIRGYFELKLSKRKHDRNAN
jgi:uncharacterized phage-associated protein